MPASENGDENSEMSDEIEEDEEEEGVVTDGNIKINLSISVFKKKTNTNMFFFQTKPRTTNQLYDNQ